MPEARGSNAAKAARQAVSAIVVAAFGGALFKLMGAPLPWILGAMTACAVAGLTGARIAMPTASRRPLAAIIGVVLGTSFSSLPDVSADWWVSFALLPTFLASAAVACIAYFRFAKVDPATAYFAGMPGGIAEMTLMGGEHGADERLIAAVHTVRIFLVVFTIPVALDLFAGHAMVAPPPPPATVTTGDAVGWTLLAWAGGTAFVGMVIGRWLRLPAYHLLGPLFLSAAIHVSGISNFQIPAWAIAATQIGLGATIGCRLAGLDRVRAVRLVVLATGSTIILLTVTLLWVGLLTQLTDLNSILQLLAYSPGGLAEMSVMALALGLEPGFVIAHHLARVVLVLIAAPIALRGYRRKTTDHP